MIHRQKDFPEGCSQSRFYHHLGQALERRDLSLPLTHPPGKTLQLDYAGKKMRWVDARSGEVHEVQVLLAVLPHSAHTFAIALPSQSTADFVHGINAALRFFGGLPKKVCPHILRHCFAVQYLNNGGILSTYHKTRALAAARKSLGIDPATIPAKKPRAERVRDLIEKIIGHPITDCPDCGAKDSLIRILLPPNARAPPADFVYVAVK